MGSPGFAVPPLVELYERGINIKAVVTQPDKERGRGLKVCYTAVKEKALELNIPVLQPVRMRDPLFIEELKNLDADLFVVVAFRILPPRVLEIPKLGSVNLHASLLPDYRGAAPINHAIFNGEKETGVTVFFLNSGDVDSGDIVNQVSTTITNDDDYGSLYDRLSFMGKNVLADAVTDILEGCAKSYRQENSSSKLAPKLFANDFIIDWTKSAESIHNRVRGLSPKPGSCTFINGKRIKFLKTAFDNISTGLEPGTVVESDCRKGYIRIAAGSGSLTVTRVQLDSRPASDVGCFLNGFKLEPGSVFT
jgi:methionyl-tRNA formyltransferase